MQPFLYIIDIISIILEVVLVVSYLRMFLKSRVSKMSEFLACVGYVMISAIIVLFTNIEIIFFLRNFLLMFAMSFLFSAKLWKRILLTLVLIILIMTTEVLVGITTSSLTGMEMGQIQSNIFYYLQGVVITKLLLLVLIKASKHYISPSDTQISKPTIMVLMLLPIATFFVIYIVSYYYTLYPNEINVYIAFSSIVSLVIANVALIFLFEWQLKQTKNLNKEILEKQQLKNQTDYYEELLENKKEYNKFVHDLKNRMFAIRDEVSNNNATGLEKLNAMCDFIEEKQQIFYTQNTAINALINSKQQKMKNHDIEFSCKATILEHNNIDDMTLCVLIGNIMDNAIEACIKLSSKRYMILDMIQQEDYLSIQLNNSCDDSIINKNLTTVKADKSMHGFGLSTIRDICSTNNGTIEILHNDGQFEVIILLKNKIQYPKL